MLDSVTKIPPQPPKVTPSANGSRAAQLHAEAAHLQDQIRLANKMGEREDAAQARSKLAKVNNELKSLETPPAQQPAPKLVRPPELQNFMGPVSIDKLVPEGSQGTMPLASNTLFPGRNTPLLYTRPLLDSGAPATVVPVKDQPPAKPGEKPENTTADGIVKDLESGKSIDVIAKERGLDRNQVIAALQAGGAKVTTQEPNSDGQVTQVTARDGHVVTEYHDFQHGTYYTETKPKAGAPAKDTPIRDESGRKYTNTYDAKTGTGTLTYEDDLGSGQTVTEISQRNGSSVETTTERGGKSSTVVTTTDGKKVTLAPNQNPAKDMDGIKKDLAAGKSIDDIAASRHLSHDQVIAEMEAAGTTVSTASGTDTKTTTVVDGTNGQKTVYSVDYQHDARTTEVTNSDGTQTSKTVDGNDVTTTSKRNTKTGETETTTVDPKAHTKTVITMDKEGRRTETVTKGEGRTEKKTVTQTYNGYTLTTAPNGDMTLTEDATGTELKIKAGEPLGAMATLLVTVNPNSKDPKTAKEAQIVKTIVQGMVDGETLPQLLQDAQKAQKARQDAVTKYGAGIPMTPPDPQEAGKEDVVDPNGPRPIGKAPSGGDWVPVDGMWVDPEVVKAMAAENVALGKLGVAQARQTRSARQLDVYQLDPASAKAHSGATSTIDKALEPYGLRWAPAKPKGTLADAKSKLNDADNRLKEAQRANSEYQQASQALNSGISLQRYALTFPDGRTPVATSADSHYDYAGEYAKGQAAQGKANVQFSQFGLHTANGDKFVADYEVGVRQSELDAAKPNTPEWTKANQALTDAKTQQGKAADNVKVTNAYLNLASASQSVADFEAFKQKAVKNYAAKNPFLFEPNKEYYSGGGDYKGKIKEREVFEKDGQLYLRLKFEHGSEEERAITFDPSDEDVPENLRNDPINQEWLTISRGWNKDSCVAGNIEDLRKNMTTAAGQLTGLKIKPIDNALTELGKTKTTLQDTVNKALADPDGATVNAPDGTLKPGEQPVKVPINGIEIQVAPDVAEAAKKGDQNAIAHAKAVRVQINGQWLWVSPEVADAQVALDLIDRQETSLKARKDNLVAAQNRYEFATARPLTYVVGPREDDNGSEKDYVDHHRGDALDGYQIQLKGFSDKFVRMENDDQLRRTVEQALGLDTRLPEGQDALNKTVGEIHDVAGDNPEVRVMPMIYVDDKVGAVQTALFEVKVGDHSEYVDVTGKHFDSVGDFQDNNTQFDEDGELVVPKNFDLTRNADGKLALDVVKARNVSVWDKTVDVAVGIGTGIATVVAIVPNPLSPFAAGAAYAGGTYFATRSVIKGVSLANHGVDWNDSEMLTNAAMGAASVLPMGAGAMRSFGLVRFATTGMGKSMTWGRAFMASNGMVNAESTAGRMASTYIQTGGSVNRMVTAGIPLADATSKSMRFAGQMNKLAHVADAGALGIGAPLMYTQARDLVLHGDEMSGLDFANAIVGLGTGTFGTGMGGRNLLRYVRGPVAAPAAAHARPTAADTQPADRGQEPVIYPDLDALIADQPFKAYPQFEVDGQELAASNPHQFLMRPDLFDQWQAGYVHPLVLKIKGPTNASLERAQEIADLGGVYVYAPRPDGRWQVMVPGEAPHYSGAIAFDPATGKVSLASDDGTVIPIRPEDYLGGLRGSGIDKTAFALLDKTVVVYREDAQYQYDDANHAIAKTRQLEEMGAPHVAKIHGLVQIHGHDALLMDTFPASDQSIEHTIRGGKEHVDVIDASLLTRRSVNSLTEIRNWIVNNNVEITDLQYLIEKDGTFNISDFMEVKTVNRLEPDYIKEIDDYVELIRSSVKNPTKPQSLSANYHDPNSPIEPSGPTIPAAFARPKPSGTRSPDAIPVWSYRAGETSDAAHGGLAYDYLSQSGAALPFGRPESKPRLGSKVQLATTLYPGRGIETFTARGGVEAAANVLHGKKNVLLVTGFNVGMDEAGKPLPETDGPPGTALLGRTLRLLGKNVTYVTDSHNAPVLKASLEALGQPTDKVIVFDAKHRFGARRAADKVLNEVNPDAVMAIELPARNTGGEYLNMRGISVKQQAMEHTVTVGGKTVKVKGPKQTVNPPLDEIVIAANLRPGIDTLGVGDGGNEAGMGNVSPLIPPAMNGLDMASSVPVDYLVTSSVSNWGAEAVAGIMLRNARRPDLLHTAGDQHAAIAAAADAGAVDGVTRRQEASVDGFPWQAHAGFHRLLSDAVADGARDTVYLGIMDSSNGGLFAANTLAEYIRLNTGRTVQRIIGVDHARAPYGKLPPENIANYTNGVLRTLDGALKGTSSHVAIAMACNTACTPGTEVIAAGVDAPVINLIDVTASAMATTGGARPVSLSTNATRDSHAYANAVTRLTDGQVTIEEIGASDAPFELAQIVNERMHESTAPADQAFVAAAAKFYAEKIPEDATSVWLTCTHYPALKPQLEAALAARGMGGVRVVDPMRYQAEAVIDQLGLPKTDPFDAPEPQRARPPVVITSGEPLPEGGTTSYGVRKSAQSFMRREDVRVVHVESFDGVTPAQLNEIRHAIYRPNLPQDGTLHEFSVPIKKDGEIVGWIPMEYFESRQRLDTFKQLDTNKDLTRAYEAVMRLLAQPTGPKPKSLSANYHDPNEPMPENARNRIPPAFRRPDTEPAAAGEREPAKGNTEPAAVEGKGEPAKTETTSGKTTPTADPAVIRFTLPEGFQAGVSWHPSAKGPGPGELPSFLLGEPSSDPSSPNYVIRITPQQIDAFLRGDRSSPKSENTTGGGEAPPPEAPKTSAEEGRGRTLWDTAKAKASHYAPWLGLNATFATVVPPQYLAVANGTAFVLRGLGTAPLAIAPGKFAANSKLGRALRLWNGLTFVANGSYHSSAYASGAGTPFNQLYAVSDNVSLAQNASETRKGKAYAPSKVEKYAGLTALNVANGFLMAEYSIPTGPGAWIPTIVFGSGAIYLTSKAIRTDLAAARANRTGAKSPATPVKGAMGAQAKAPLDLRIANGAVAVGLVGFGLGYLMNMAKADDKQVQLPSGVPTDTATTQPPVDRPTEPPPETKNPYDKKQPPGEKPQPQQFVVTASDGLNIRGKPDAGAAKEATVEPGGFVKEAGKRTVDSTGHGWIPVKGFGMDGRMHEGWVSADYVEVHPQGASNAEGRLNPTLEKQGFHWVPARNGDSIRAIAVANSRDVARTVILNMDHIVRPDLIFAGDRIYLPA